MGLATLLFAAIPLGARAATMSYTLSISSDLSLLTNPTNKTVQNAVAQDAEAVVNTAANNPVFSITNTSTTDGISDIKVNLTDVDSVYNAALLPASSPSSYGAPTTSVWGGSTKTIDIVLPTVLAPNQTLTFAVNLGPLGGFPSTTWQPGYENIL